MDVSDLFRLIRQEAIRRIASGEITQSELARRTGVSQPTLSAYLKDYSEGKPLKNLSEKRINALVVALGLNVEHFTRSQQQPIPSEKRLIPRVSQRTAIRSRYIPPNLVEGTTGITYIAAEKDARKGMQEILNLDRFVAITASPDHVRFMHPAIKKESTLVIDRYDLKVELEPSAKRTIYALSDGDKLTIGYLKVIGAQLQLLPDANEEDPISVRLGYRSGECRVVGTVNTIVHHPHRESKE